jgi:hypothetical protein
MWSHQSSQSDQPGLAQWVQARWVAGLEEAGLRQLESQIADLDETLERLRGRVLHGPPPLPDSQLSGLARSGLELSGLELSGLELSGLELSGLEVFLGVPTTSLASGKQRTPHRDMTSV